MIETTSAIQERTNKKWGSTDISKIISTYPLSVCGGRYGNSSGRVRGGPAFWFENLTAEIVKIVHKINN